MALAQVVQLLTALTFLCTLHQDMITDVVQQTSEGLRGVSASVPQLLTVYPELPAPLNEIHRWCHAEAEAWLDFLCVEGHAVLGAVQAEAVLGFDPTQVRLPVPCFHHGVQTKEVGRQG